MKTRTKVQYIPTVLLDNVLAIKLKQHKQKKKNLNISSASSSRKVVIYKMISTEEWKKKEDARIASEAKLKAVREAPKSERSLYAYASSITTKKKIHKTSAEQRKYAKEYYFKNKERLQQYQRTYYEKRWSLTKPKIPPTDANA